MDQSKWATPPPSVPLPAPEKPSQDVREALSPPAPDPAPSMISFPDLQDAAQPSLPLLDQPVAFDDSLDEFAQTRPPDDLFSDDFEPITEPVVEEPPRPAQKVASYPKGAQRASRPNGGDAQPSPASTEVKPQGVDGPRVEAVRGDRSGTGGIKKAKLTEEQMSARIESIKVKNQSLEAAHARAEADEASFQAREVEAQQKRKVERQNRQQMMGERERNRLRKMNALGGREWDATKDEEDQVGSVKGSRFRRGAHGGVAMDPRPVPSGPDEGAELYDDREKGRDGRRGRGRGRGQGRGGGVARNGSEALTKTTEQSIPTSVDFPSLPGSAPSAIKNKTKKADRLATEVVAAEPRPGPIITATNGKSWAEEMESSPAAATSSG